ncbi:hypothetical protein ROHU_030849 [Labeo rohita]|uniref:Uncharacterized protein n=2 Tax=Labeo rohita TaxID=84645 RepID=A0A498LQA4_LABRO|nr:uncharacterized protein si:dkey-247k7.2 [Labeo rohita]KAI2655287.1 tRNA(Met) cytidine acetate ligase [Labeo rohita]RXN05440.1 hypothetical protein ROHU_033456 [Labeo rohita]RXN10271.1 hypothetical protein ROHU_030849 [Labeo rohita]
MAQFGHLVAVLSLCLLAVVVNSQENPPPPRQGQEICTQYTNSGTQLLDMPKVFQMMQIEFGWAIQTLNPMVIQQWMDDVDDDHDKLLNLAECAKLVQRVSDSIRRPNTQP